MMPGNPVVGSTILRRPAIQSPNYVAGSAGWSINADGSAEFNNVTVRGTFAGTNWVINSTGEFRYSSTPAAGNLVASDASAAGIDGEGNNYVAGYATYGSGVATAVQDGQFGIYSGSLSGGWTLEATLETDVFGDLLLAVTGSGSVQLLSQAVAGAGLTVDGTLTVNGSVDTGAPIGTGFFDTQGLASGSYGSTHQHTLPNFPTATHTHPL